MNAEQPTEESRRVLKRYSAQERGQLIEAYEASGKTRQAFCEERGLKLATFHGWLKKDVKSAPGFTEVEITTKGSAPIEIGLPGGARVGVYLNGDQSELIRLCRGILGCAGGTHKC